MSNRYFPIDEYHERWKTVQAAMRAKSYDYALVWGKTGGTYERSGDMVYLANYYSTHSGHEPDSKLWNGRAFSALLMPSSGDPKLHTDEAGPVRSDIVAVENVEWHWDVPNGVGKALKRDGIKGRIAFVGSDFFPVKYMRQLQAHVPDIEFVIDDDLVRDVRRIKSARELDCFREAGEIVSNALTLQMEALISGKTEAEAAAIGASEVIKRGGNYHRIPMSHGDTINFFERRPISGYSLDAPKPGDMVRSWIYGPIWQGYWLDPGRTAVCGKPNSAQKHLIESVVNLCEDLRSRIKPGVSVLEIAKLGERLSVESGYDADQAKEMWPYFGHGNGCMWEAPFIESRACSPDEKFEANMVASVETFLLKDGVGAAGFETNYIVTETGTELLTTTPNVFW